MCKRCQLIKVDVDILKRLFTKVSMKVVNIYLTALQHSEYPSGLKSLWSGCREPIVWRAVVEQAPRRKRQSEARRHAVGLQL